MPTINTATNNADTFVRSQTPTTNLGGDTNMQCQGDFPTQDYRSFIRFTLPAIPVAGAVITDIKLYLYVEYFVSPTNAWNGINVHELTRTDWVENQLTWNIYKTGSNWTTAGGDFNATVITNKAVTATGFMYFPIQGSEATNPLSKDWGDQIDLILKPANVTTPSNENYCGFSTKENSNSARRPYLEVTYEVDGQQSNFLMFM